MVQVRQGSKGEGRSVQHVSAFAVRLSPYLALIVAVSAFLSISLHQLALPGLYYDEALDLVPMLQVMHGEPVTLLRGIGLSLGNYTYPIMLMEYMGSLNGYLSLPFLALFGPGVVAARVAPIFFSAVTIVLTFALARSWFGRSAAAVTALLLAVNPSFIWFSRQGISVTSVMTVFSLGSLLLLDQWRRREKRDWRSGIRDSSFVIRHSSISNLLLIAAGLLLGLGLWAKLIFLWWIVALGAMALVWLLASPRQIGHKLAQMVRPALWVLLGLLIGAAPLIYYNLYDLLRQPFDLHHAYTLGLLFKSLGQPTDYGVNNLDFWANLQKAIADFNVFIDGSYFWYNGVPYSNVYAVPTFVIAVIVGSVLAFVRHEWHKWLAVLAAIAVTVLISAFTVSGLWATHLFIMLPLPQMVVAVAAVWLACAGAQAIGRVGARESGSKGAARNTAPGEQGSEVVAGFTPATSTPAISNPQSPISRSPSLHLTPAPWLPRALAPLLVVILLALPVWRDLWVSEQHHATLTRTGGSGRFSDAVYKLATHLDTEHIDAPIALDWGIEKSVRVLTADRVRPEEIFGFSAQPDDTFKQQVQELLRDPSRQYIVLWDRFAVYNRRQAFTQIANSMGMQVTETFIAHEQSGLPVYVMLQAK
jgi:4-amino-4-deoxy-L-arabinose transferase-like glycosyltransferase